MSIKIDESDINRLKVIYHEKWDTEEFKYMKMQIPSKRICFTNDLDCDGALYFGYPSFPDVIEKIAKWASI